MMPGLALTLRSRLSCRPSIVDRALVLGSISQPRVLCLQRKSRGSLTGCGRAWSRLQILGGVSLALRMYTLG